jgi:glycosyltransferase involved in cell wall biosynthesis
VGRAVDSVVSQTVMPAEIILIEDGSEDTTLETLYSIAKLYPNLIKVVVLSPNQGLANARNTGWEVASQPFIAFLDADDAWHPRKIEIQYKYMVEHPDIALCGHAHRVTSQTDELPSWNIDDHVDDCQINKNKLLLSNQFVAPSVMLKRDIKQRFVTGKRHMEDHVLWLEILCSGGKVTMLSAELVAIYKGLFGVSGLSSQLWSMQKGDLSNYLLLYKNKHINFVQWLGLSFYSIAKFIRRLIIVQLRKLGFVSN